MFKVQPHFYPRSPCGERQARRASRQQPAGISIHALLAESDRFYPLKTLIILPFLSTLSLRRATGGSGAGSWRLAIFLSTLSLRRATDICANNHVGIRENFYPRSPCGERLNYFDFSRLWRDFYPRSPCGERLMHALELASSVLFLSTLSLRRATLTSVVSSAGTIDFYPRSPCGERRCFF